MPIYEYLCERCGKVHEIFQKVNDKPPSRCDDCGGRKLAKMVSRSAFQLKGGGWYSDLYASRKPDAGGSRSATEKATEKAAASGTPAKEPKEAKAPATPAPAAPAPSAPTPAASAPKPKRA